jgi:hypothetical protein
MMVTSYPLKPRPRRRDLGAMTFESPGMWAEFGPETVTTVTVSALAQRSFHGRMEEEARTET